MNFLKKRSRPQLALGMRGGRVSSWLVGLALFVLALIPRITLGSFVTVDEAYYWFGRANRFLQAMATGRYTATNQVGHPGVTTMWLGAAGIELQHGLEQLGLLHDTDAALARALMRLPVAAATSLCLALSYLLLVRLLGRRIALLAALLWASEPFLVAHSQLLHVDALLTSFSTLALLAALVAFRFDADPGGLEHCAPRWGYLVASGVCGGLALLTKSPAIILLPTMVLIALVAAWRAAPSIARLARRLWPSATWPALVWAAVAAVVWVALWPAMWVDPAHALSKVLHQAIDDGGSPHGWGNYFLGRAVSDPGPLFYPVALAFRLAPWTLLGLIVVPFTHVGFRTLGVASSSDALDNQKSATRNRPVLAVLAAFALLFLITMSIPPKKFDRYALPVVPALDILAAVGLLSIVNCTLHIVERWRKQCAIYNVQFVAWVLVLLALALNLAWFHPYEIAYYNQVLGGGQVASRFIPIGWGEGYEQVGSFLRAQPDGASKPVATWFEPVLRPFVRGSVVPLSRALTPGRVGYVVLYIDQIQRQDVPEAIAQYYGKVAPVYTVRIHGIDYAYVYQALPAIDQPVQATFGDNVRLIGYRFDAEAAAATDVLTVTLNWQAHTALPENYLLFAHLLDEHGQVVARADVLPGGPTSGWQANRFVTGMFRLPIGAIAEPGRYWLSLGLYDPDSGQRLSLSATAPPGAPNDGPDALRLPITLPATMPAASPP